MSKGKNQKLKFPLLMRIMLEKTDDEHGLTMAEILDELKLYDVSAERKSIADDFQEMEDHFGIEIIKEQVGRETRYHVGSREFELAEVKLLIDAVQSSKFITEKKSRELIKKVKGLVSKHQAAQLQRQVVIRDRVKTINESVYYNVDEIHNAINSNCKIRFKYYKWDISKKLVPRNNGDFFKVSPWALTWDDENYYLVALDDWDGRIKHYRVDKMNQIELTGERREGREEFRNFDMAKYSKSTFGMFHGEKTRVSICFENSKCGVFFDRFGKDQFIRKVDENHSEISVEVFVSPQFFGWIFSLGPEVKVTGPENVVAEMRSAAEAFMANLGGER